MDRLFGEFSNDVEELLGRNRQRPRFADFGRMAATNSHFEIRGGKLQLICGSGTITRLEQDMGEDGHGDTLVDDRLNARKSLEQFGLADREFHRIALPVW